MTTDHAAQQPMPDLVAVGWTQGVLFVVSPAQVSWIEHNAGDIEVRHRPLKTSDKLIVISQTCDIKVALGAEPRVEALVCSVLPANFVQQIRPNSARWFVIDRDANLVAVARDRVLVSKQVLAHVTPEPWPGSAELRDDFVRWLARRYDRPAVPDLMVSAFQKPVEAAVRELMDGDVSVGAVFNSVVREVRINLPEDLPPPLQLEVTFLLVRRELTPTELSALETIFDAALHAVDASVVKLAPHPRVLSAEEMSVADYFSTVRLFFDDITMDGMPADAAEPMGW